MDTASPHRTGSEEPVDPRPRTPAATLDVVIVDDEELARQRLCDLLEGHPTLRVRAECKNGREAVDTIRRSAPDLVFLDIDMPDLDGFGVIRELGRQMPTVIFVTAYDQYAVRAFDAAAVDYLLKPYDRQRFERALERALDSYRKAQVGELERRMDKLLALGVGRDTPGPSPGPGHPLDDRLVVREGGTVHLVRVDDIDWVESARNYVKIHCGDDVFTMRETLTHLEERLDPERFLRIHRSTLVNVERIQRIEPGYGSESRLELDNGATLVISRAYRRGKVRELLEALDA